MGTVKLFKLHCIKENISSIVDVENQNERRNNQNSEESKKFTNESRSHVFCRYIYLGAYDFANLMVLSY